MAIKGKPQESSNLMTHVQPPINLEQMMHEPVIVCDIDDTIIMEPEQKHY